MSGIFGLFNQGRGSPVVAADLQRMASLLTRRGPDGTGSWRRGQAGLGHTLLTTTPEALFERQPLEHTPSGCVITADVRLDNRDELLTGLDLRDRAAIIGDAEAILMAYLSWGESCVERFLGDFAFAIWDVRRQALFCARDHFGMRPFYYHHAPGRLFAFASEPRAILALPQTPYRINEARIADFLVPELEGIDKTSTFFEEVYRLPPAHTLTVSPQGVQQRPYWTIEPSPELRLPSNEAYAEAFLERFTEAVRCRLRGAGPVGAMLSGGMDSGSVVAVASALLTNEGGGSLPTFSATAPDANKCIETRTIYAAQTMPGLNPCTIQHSELDQFMSELEELTWHLDEPFDYHMTLLRVIYFAARRHGINVMLDGASGDSVLSEGSHLARLLRRGRWLRAYHEAVGLERFWGSTYPAWRQIYRSARSAFAPNAVRRLSHHVFDSWSAQQRAEQTIRESIINPQFARRASLAERLRTLDGHRSPGLSSPYGTEHAQSIGHPYLTVGRERYGRVAAALAVEPRDPFLDRRMVAFCLALPGAQKLSEGWPKVILRRAMANRLPDAVRWRPGKQHLGWSFTVALMEKMRNRMRLAMEANWGIIAPYVNVGAMRSVCRSYFDGGDPSQAEKLYEAAHLAVWLCCHIGRPQVASWTSSVAP
jgi:asparagine synthase (glutamine-hydrolysing)